MNFVKLSIVAVTLAAFYLSGPAVNAQEREFADIRILSPEPDALVGPTFTISGASKPDCPARQLLVTDSAGTKAGIDATPSIDSSGSGFSYAVDVRKPLIRDGQPFNPSRYVQPGKATFEVVPGDCDAGGGGIITVNIRTAQSGEQGRVQTQASPSPSPSPSVVPAASAAPGPALVKESFFDKLDPQWWLLIGLLSGAILLGLAELTAHRYHKKHPRKNDA